MNLMMISQTAQGWSSDDVSSSLRSEKEILASENERLTVYLSVIIVQFVCFELY